MVLALLEKLKLPEGTTICEPTAQDTLALLQKGEISPQGAQTMLQVDGDSSNQGTHEHFYNGMLMTDETAQAILNLLNG